MKRAPQTMCWEGCHFSCQRCRWDEPEINVYSVSRIAAVTPSLLSLARRGFCYLHIVVALGGWVALRIESNLRQCWAGTLMLLSCTLSSLPKSRTFQW